MREILSPDERSRKLLRDPFPGSTYPDTFFLQIAVDNPGMDVLYLEIETTSGTPTIHWGDGTQDTILAMEKNYLSTGTYDVTLTGVPYQNITLIEVDSPGDMEFNFHPDLTSMVTLTAMSFQTGTFVTHHTWTSLLHLSINAPNIDDVQLHPSWPNILSISVIDSNLDSIHTHPEWTTLTSLNFRSNGLVTMNTHGGWSSLTSFNVSQNFLEDIELHPEWPVVDINVSGNLITDLVTHPEWVAMTTLKAPFNSNLESVTVHPEWTALTTLELQSCNLPDLQVDDMLVQLDVASGIKPLAFLKYENNPGSLDINRSPAAAAAKISLASKGWVITN